MGAEHTMMGRINTAATAFRIWREHPFFGIGFRRYMEVKGDYQETVEVPVFGVIRRSQGFESSLHDIYLGVLAEEGIVGMGLQIAIWIMVLRAFWQKYRLRRQGDYFATYILPVFGGLFVAYWVGGIAFDYRYFSAIGGLFYFAAGITYGYEGEGQSAERRTDDEPVPTIASV
jgi:O-antigen ligase